MPQVILYGAAAPFHLAQVLGKSPDLFRQDFSFCHLKASSSIDIDIVPERKVLMRKAKTRSSLLE